MLNEEDNKYIVNKEFFDVFCRKECFGNNLMLDYQIIRNEIDGYFKLRNSILIVAVSSMAIVLGLKEIEEISKIIALYSIIVVAVTVTYSYTTIARRKSAYAKVFIEDSVKELNWLTTLMDPPDELSKINQKFNKKKWPIDFLPYEFPAIYFLLNVVVVIYSSNSIIKEFSIFPSIVVVVGFLTTLCFVLALQYSLSYSQYEALINYYQNLKGENGG